MINSKRVKVLIVDDSMLFREILVKKISVDPSIQVVGTAKDPFEARDKIIELEPDVVTLDVEMPKMNGIEFLKKLMPQYPLPVVVVSAVSNNVFDALKAGAVDFVTKPDARNPNSLEAFISELIMKIKIASVARVGQVKKVFSATNYIPEKAKSKKIEVIAIGASTGGTEAIYEAIREFPKNMPGIVIVQHMPPVFTKMYAERLNNTCIMEVKEAETGDMILPGRVLIAPGEYHMKVVKKGPFFSVECFKGEKVNGHCPSVDVLFDSVAEKVGASSLGVILTGMGYDGAKGLLKMKEKGAITLGQDEQSCVVYGMPEVAYSIGAVEKQVALKNISQVVQSIAFSK